MPLGNFGFIPDTINNIAEKVSILIPYQLHFKRPATTSRDTLKTRQVWFLLLEENGKIGIGECAPIGGLSSETPEQAHNSLQQFANNPNDFDRNTAPSSVRFAIETATLDLQSGGQQLLFPSTFTDGEQDILINGLIWLGDKEFMQRQIEAKLAQGCRCIKLKIGALDFAEELQLLTAIRKRYRSDQLTLRVDANGAFSPDIAASHLQALAALDIHSIEQPIRAGQWQEMAALCQKNYLPIALDEELIGIEKLADKERLLTALKPQYLVLKPSLHGGFGGCEQWIELAEKHGIAWWVTSYLESNIGLNAIAQWFVKMTSAPLYERQEFEMPTTTVPIHQGLGTGQLYTNNIASPLTVSGERLSYRADKAWNLSALLEEK